MPNSVHARVNAVYLFPFHTLCHYYCIEILRSPPLHLIDDHLGLPLLTLTVSGNEQQTPRYHILP